MAVLCFYFDSVLLAAGSTFAHCSILSSANIDSVAVYFKAVCSKFVYFNLTSH